MDDISRHKPELSEKQRQLRDLLCEWDPIGVMGIGAPREEYDCLLGITGYLRGEMSEASLAEYLETQLRDHFGLDPRYARPAEFAHRVFRWYWADPIPASSALQQEVKRVRSERPR